MYLMTILELKIPLIRVNHEKRIFPYYNPLYLSVDRCDTKVEILKSNGVELVVSIYLSIVGSNKM